MLDIKMLILDNDLYNGILFHLFNGLNPLPLYLASETRKGLFFSLYWQLSECII